MAQANKTGVLYKHQRRVGAERPCGAPLTYMMNGLINHSHLSLVVSVEVSDDVLFCRVASTPPRSVSFFLCINALCCCCCYQIFPLKKSLTLKGESHVLCMYVCLHNVSKVGQSSHGYVGAASRLFGTANAGSSSIPLKLHEPRVIRVLVSCCM